MFENEINTLTINKNADGTYRLSGRINYSGKVVIPRAKIKLTVEVLKEDNNEQLMTISFNDLEE